MNWNILVIRGTLLLVLVRESYNKYKLLKYENYSLLNIFIYSKLKLNLILKVKVTYGLNNKIKKKFKVYYE